jgi:hypothetical protein
VPLADILDVLPPGLPLSIELPPDNPAIGATDWARLVRQDAEGYLRRYYAAKQR